MSDLTLAIAGYRDPGYRMSDLTLAILAIPAILVAHSRWTRLKRRVTGALSRCRKHSVMSGKISLRSYAFTLRLLI
jgi:hypothetical protein